MRAAKQPKTAPGRPFKKGTSGNPKGRPPKGYSLAEFVRAKLEDNGGEKLEQVFMALYQRAIDPDGPVEAAKELLTRAYGKPIDTVKFEDVTQRERPEGVLSLARSLRANTSTSGPT